jgi:hypothetical protein
MTDPNLHLHEEILLLALDDEKGTIGMGSLWNQAAGGAMVAELMLAGRVTVGDQKKGTLTVVDPTPVGDPLLDQALAEIADREKPRKGSDWVQHFAGWKKLHHRIAGELVRKRVLREEEGKVLWIFDTVHYPERDGRHEREVIRRLREAIFTDGDDVTPRTMVLVTLADAAGLLGEVFDKKQLKGRKERLKAIREGEAAGQMTRDAIEAVQTAMMVAAVVPTMVVATTSGN